MVIRIDMPYRPPVPCKKQGCPNLTHHPRGVCQDHLAEVYREEDRDRQSSSERGYDARWNKARAFYLAHHPLCVECQKEGRTEPAVVVDHIKPHRGDISLFWDESNWQSLCKMHHDIKTARKDGAFIKRF